MDKIKELSSLLYSFFATDQNYHIEQQDDGIYTKKPGAVSAAFIEKSINNKRSFAVYQKNSDSTVKWICFDFDILKRHINKNSYSLAEKELNRAVSLFLQTLTDFNLSHLLEYSGNRGFHVWITLDESISYQVAHRTLEAILMKIDLKYDDELIGIDLFPKSKSPSDGVGSGVKMPLSLHRKSNYYSTILTNAESIDSYQKIDTLSPEIIDNQLAILKFHKSVNTSYIEKKLDVFIDLTHNNNYEQNRIKVIKIQNKGFTLSDLIEHWQNFKPLKLLAECISHNQDIDNSTRILLVGLLGNIYCKDKEYFRKEILHSIFNKTTNYKYQKTEHAIETLSSFHFPSQKQIEDITHEKFEKIFSVEELIQACIPKYVSFEDATFEFSKTDIVATAVAELNYLFQNDEAQVRVLINQLTHFDSLELLQKTNDLNGSKNEIQFYRHHRKETNKTRTLVTLGLTERILTSSIIKQLDHFFCISPNINSHGYQLNKGFKDGYIFKPWLYSWIEFLSNINSAIDDEAYQDYYIVKTDLEGFYDNIPHDNIKRMLFGELSSEIFAKVSSLKGESLEKYKGIVHKLVEITGLIMNSNKGLPQGPAYARYIAELYLDHIDIKFDSSIKLGDLFLYQRYVDDIFFLAESEELANEMLESLKSDLETLGLSINSSKTMVKQVKNFREDFNKYRSQSKYAVDRISKNYDDATDTQKDLAIKEFLKLLQSETCEDDLAFIFSHLSGVKQLDDLKKTKVVSTLKKGVGRGSLYKHLFNFVLDNNNNWGLLDEIESFDALQSEVLSSCIINMLENNEGVRTDFNEFIEGTISKLTKTEIVDQHLAYMHVNFDIQIKITNILPKVFISSIVSSIDQEKIFISSQLIEHINTELNNIKDLSEFIEAIYPLCISSSTLKIDLNRLASTYYTKLAFDKQNDKLSTTHSPLITTIDSARKFYYLLCLFSISDVFKSTDILKYVWEYCTHIFNSIDIPSNSYLIHNWLKKIDDIEIDRNNSLFIITAVTDGALHRGLLDEKKIFEKFHSTIFVYVAMEKKLLDAIELKDALKDLKNVSQFYEWLIDNSSVTMFPNNKSWFEKNIILNNTIMLQKNNEILVRKPTFEFVDNQNIKNEHLGYSEVIEKYNPEDLQSINEVCDSLTFTQSLKFLIDNLDEDNALFPNIYTHRKVLLKDTLTPFTKELSRSNSLILQNKDDNVTSFDNNLDSYINCFFDVISNSKNGSEFKQINERYIQNLNSHIKPLEFIRQMSFQLSEFDDLRISNKFYYDVAIASAVYSSIKEDDIVKKIDKFVNQYHKFNPETDDRHIYAVDITLTLNDVKPRQLLKSVISSLEIIPKKIISNLPFYLFRDIVALEKIICKIENIAQANNPSVDLDQFQLTYPRLSTINQELIVERKKYKFHQVKLFNVHDTDLQQLEDRHAVIIDSAEHFYYLENNGNLFIIAIPSSISKIYLSIIKRHSVLSDNNQSYPPVLPTKKSIKSLNNYDKAITKIAIHQDISKDSAVEILHTWLSSLPTKFHQPLVTLISAHVVMDDEDINCFLEKFHSSVKEKSSMNPFLIKSVKDNNGTHRVLSAKSKDGKNTRVLDDLNPSNIVEGSDQATIVVDNIITGSQISRALKYYLNIEKDKSTYFTFNEEESKAVEKKLKSLKTLNICTILYTDKGIDKIKEEWKKHVGSEININVISGRVVFKDIFFSTTEQIGIKEKEQIIELLTDKHEIKNLFNNLNCSASSKDKLLHLTKQEIYETNLIARYKSLPKKCFSFLQYGLQKAQDCRPMIRVLENNE